MLVSFSYSSSIDRSKHFPRQQLHVTYPRPLDAYDHCHHGHTTPPPTAPNHHPSQEEKTVVPPGLGPGSYDVRDVKQLGRARSRKNIMISSQARFTDPSTPKTNNPGPGHYGTEMVYGNLLKQVGVQNVELKPAPYCAAFIAGVDRCKPLVWRTVCGEFPALKEQGCS